jgi:hypothetical protein
MPFSKLMLFAVLLVAVGGVLTIAGALIVGWHTTASRNLVLACAAVISAIFFSVIQGWLELRELPNRDGIAVAFLLDSTAPAIRHIRKADGTQSSQSAVMITSLRMIPEQSANAVLASLTPKPDFDSLEAESFSRKLKIITDFAIFSLLHYIKLQQPDWQARYMPIETPFIGTRVLVPTASFTTRKCTDLGEQEIRALLRASDNVFALASLNEFETNPLCLPPRSVMKIEKDSLTITNPFLSTSFTVNFHSGGGGTMIFYFDVVTRYSALLSQHRSIFDYRQWIERLIADARPWFGVPQ